MQIDYQQPNLRQDLFKQKNGSGNVSLGHGVRPRPSGKDDPPSDRRPGRARGCKEGCFLCGNQGHRAVQCTATHHVDGSIISAKKREDAKTKAQELAAKSRGRLRQVDEADAGDLEDTPAKQVRNQASIDNNQLLR